MNKILYIVSLLCLCALSATAQQKEYKGKMGVTPLQVEQVGDSLQLRIEFDFQRVAVKARRSITLTPVLVAPNRKIKLQEVLVKGRIDFLTSKREVALMSRAERKVYDQHPPYAIAKGYKHKGQGPLLYQKTIAFEPWMKEARLDIQEDLCGCGKPPRLLAVAPLVGKVQLVKPVEPYIVRPYMAYVQPAVEAVKKREVVGEAFLDFVVSKIDIRPEYMNNPRELKKITDMVQEVRGDAAITVRGISVEGYASPEGTLQFNQFLSEGRAEALVGYLVPRFDYPKYIYKVAFGGENWKGLQALVEGGDMPYRDEVLHILNTVPAQIDYRANTSRKKALMSLHGGVPYRYMLKEYYPSLRKAMCKIDYQVKGFDVVEAKEVFKTRPQNLSLNEMYLVANTYEVGSQEFIDVFETAARMFPWDETANLNAASAALTRNDLGSAERYLNKVLLGVDMPEYNNARGVWWLLKGDYDQAKTHLESAATADLEQAKQNLEELHRKVENNQAINNH